MSTSEAQIWSFSRHVFGYNAEEVDDYLTRVTQYAESLEQRAVALESSLEERTRELAEAHRRLGEANGEEVGGRVSEILALAENEARDIRERAQAVERTSAERAAATADRILAETTEERRLLERQVVEISATRDNLLRDLRSLGGQIIDTADHYDTRMTQPPTLNVFDAEPRGTEPSSEPRDAPADTHTLPDKRDPHDAQNGAR
jgi:cell division septum initiation protein DivIVA